MEIQTITQEMTHLNWTHDHNYSMKSMIDQWSMIIFNPALDKIKLPVQCGERIEHSTVRVDQMTLQRGWTDQIFPSN